MLLEVLKALLCLIPPGYVTSYGQLAKVLGIPPRLIGALLAANDEPIKYPCHRVVMSDGRIGGYSGPCGVKLKEKLLMLEGVRLSQGKVDKTAFYDISTVLLSASEVG